MANYDEPLPTGTNPVPPVKRVRYFDTQLLHDQDFVDQQMYEIVQRHRREQLLQVAGIASGLDVTQFGTLGTATQVQVTPGNAFDSNGRHIMLSNPRTLDVPAATGTAAPPGSMSVYIQFHEEASDAPSSSSADKSTRWTQNPTIFLVAPAASVPPDALLLATLSLNAQRQITAISKSGRSYTGVNLPVPMGAPKLTLCAGSDAGTAEFSGNLRLASGTLTANTLTANALSVGGAAGSGSPLTVSGSSAHLQLRRAGTETQRGAILYLELFQDVTATGGNTNPCIRFHHGNRFWHRLEAQADGLHVRTGDLSQGGYSGLRAGSGTFDTLTSTGSGTFGSLESTGSGTFGSLTCNGSVGIANNQGGDGARLDLASGDPGHYIYSTGSGDSRCFFGEAGGGWHFQNTSDEIDGQAGPAVVARIDGSGGFHSRSGTFFSESDQGWSFQGIFKEKLEVLARIDGSGGLHSRSGVFQNELSGHQLHLQPDGNVTVANRDGLVLSIWKAGEGKSDLRLKRDLLDLGGALEAVTRLRPVRFRFQGALDDGHEHLGLIAQEVEAEFPELVDTDPDGYKRIHYARLSSVLVQAVKELNARIDALGREERQHGD